MTHLLENAGSSEIDLTDPALCAEAAQSPNLAALQLLRGRGVSWTCDVVTHTIRNHFYATTAEKEAELQLFLRWALDNGVPLGNDADPHDALNFACQQNYHLALRLLIDCYRQRNLHLDLSYEADALVRRGAVLCRPTVLSSYGGHIR